MFKYLFSRFWDYFSPCDIIDRLSGGKCPPCLVDVEVAVMRCFPDDWFDQNDPAPVPAIEAQPEEESYW